MKFYQIILILFVIFLDQISKYIIKLNFYLGESIKVIGDFFRLTYVTNQGIAFGAFNKSGNLFLYLTPVAIGLLIYLYWSIKNKTVLYRICFSLIIGGAVGNYLDRVIRGYVIDFFDVDFFNINISKFTVAGLHFPGYTLDRWPAFNVADSVISVGITVLIIYSFFVDFKK